MGRISLAGSVGAVAVTVLALASAAQPAAAASCPTTVGNRAFASAAQLHANMKKIVGFGQLRNAGSRSLNQEQRWLESRLERIRGMGVRSDPYYVRSWQPTTEVKKGPGRDLARSGELRLPGPSGSTRVPVAGAVPYSRPTNNRGSGGPLVRTR